MFEIVSGWHGFWQFVFLFFLLYAAISAALRVVVIVVRGWPPPHLDADGDAVNKWEEVR